MQPIRVAVSPNTLHSVKFMDVWHTTLGSFLLAFSALVSIVNPFGASLIYYQVLASQTHAVRARIARKIGVYAAIVMLVALWAGAHVIGFFGISLAALRMAGGLVVAVRGFQMLMAPQETDERKQEQAAPARVSEDIVFFPLTIPFTTGPGTISVAIALSANRPSDTAVLLPFIVGVSIAALVVALIVGVCYTYADSLIKLLGPGRSRVLARLAAFLLLCIGTQILLNGVSDAIVMISHRLQTGA